MTNILTALTITLATNWVPVHTQGTNQVQAGVIYQVEQVTVERNGVRHTFLLSSNVTDQPLLRRELFYQAPVFSVTNYTDVPWTLEPLDMRWFAHPDRTNGLIIQKE